MTRFSCSKTIAIFNPILLILSVLVTCEFPEIRYCVCVFVVFGNKVQALVITESANRIFIAPSTNLQQELQSRCAPLSFIREETN